jgi:hypothetical protein
VIAFYWYSTDRKTNDEWRLLMARIINNTTVENLKIKSPFNKQNVKEFGLVTNKEPDFAELHALFEIQYKQFLTDTSDEIAKRAQRLLELESIVHGDPLSE